MQAVDIRQLVPQQTKTQTQDFSQKTGDTTFMDLLKSEQSSSDTDRKITQTNTSEKTVSSNQNIASEKSDSKSDKVKDSSKQEDDKKKSMEAENKNGEELAQVVVRQENLNGKNGQKVLSKKIDENGVVVKNDGKTVAKQNLQQSEQLAWLASTQEELADENSDDDFAALIDSAKEFIPGEESDAEQLERSQNLAATDPALFLNTVDKKPVVNEKNNKIDDDKKLISKDSKLKTTVSFEVRDERTKIEVPQEYAKKEIIISSEKQDGNNAQLTMDLASHAQQNITSSSSQTAAAAGSDFQGMLTNAIQQNAPEFVKAGSIVLKDNNQGTINLILHPESLGNVKISLSLSDKVIAGQITVHSQEAYNAFKESIDSIKQAFAQNGFETAGFNLNFTGNGNFAGGGQSGQQMDSQYRANQTYGDYAKSSVIDSEKNDAAYDNQNFYAVDIVA